MNKGFLKLIKNIAILLTILIITDMIVGWLGIKYASWLNQIPRDGEAALINYDLNAAVPDVAIVGNSFASCHYVPSIIHDSVEAYINKDFSVFNMGMSKQRLSYNYYVLKCLIDRKPPQILIANVWATYLSVTDETKLFAEFRPYIKMNHNVREMLEKHNEYNFLMKSNMFCFNTELVKLLMSPLKPKHTDGFITSHSKLERIGEKGVSKDPAALSPLSVEEFDAMIDLAKKYDILMAVVISPTLSSSHSSDTNSLSYRYMKEKCQNENVLFLDYSNNEKYYKAEYFRDIAHMNYYGAIQFSKDLMSDLKESIVEKYK